jgi:hypothetical protein
MALPPNYICVMKGSLGLKTGSKEGGNPIFGKRKNKNKRRCWKVKKCKEFRN